MIDRPIRQIAYFVADVRDAATAHAASFGSGPYYVADHIPLSRCLYRGAAETFDHSSAYGQWGPLMIEFVQQHNPGPSACHDMYPEGSGRGGLHHVALFVDDIDAEIARLGYPVAMDAAMATGFRFVMVDAVAACGHMIELYPPEPSLTDFYALVASVAGDFSQGVLRPISF